MLNIIEFIFKVSINLGNNMLEFPSDAFIYLTKQTQAKFPEETLPPD